VRRKGSPEQPSGEEKQERKVRRGRKREVPSNGLRATEQSVENRKWRGRSKSIKEKRGNSNRVLKKKKKRGGTRREGFFF